MGSGLQVSSVNLEVGACGNGEQLVSPDHQRSCSHLQEHDWPPFEHSHGHAPYGMVAVTYPIQWGLSPETAFAEHIGSLYALLVLFLGSLYGHFICV